MQTEVRDTEALRLITAFFQIEDQEARRVLVSLAEATAAGAALTIDNPMLAKPATTSG